MHNWLLHRNVRCNRKRKVSRSFPAISCTQMSNRKCKYSDISQRGPSSAFSADKPSGSAPLNCHHPKTGRDRGAITQKDESRASAGRDHAPLVDDPHAIACIDSTCGLALNLKLGAQAHCRESRDAAPTPFICVRLRATQSHITLSLPSVLCSCVSSPHPRFTPPPEEEDHATVAHQSRPELQIRTPLDPQE